MGDRFAFLKGHGTENDFVVLPDPDGRVHGELSPDLVRRLCDRRAGVGGDGVLRAVRCASYDDPWAVAARDRAEWFMDYRNSDGSVAQMCGNGVRVFARYLADHAEVATDRPLPIGTRDGVKVAHFAADGQVGVDMGRVELLGETKVGVGDRSWPASRVSTGNPHAVAFVDDLGDAGPLTAPPSYVAGDFPDGVNVEFVVRRGPRHVAMRVHERGAGGDPVLRHRRLRGGSRRRGRTGGGGRPLAGGCAGRDAHRHADRGGDRSADRAGRAGGRGRGRPGRDPRRWLNHSPPPGGRVILDRPAGNPPGPRDVPPGGYDELSQHRALARRAHRAQTARGHRP